MTELSNKEFNVSYDELGCRHSCEHWIEYDLTEMCK